MKKLFTLLFISLLCFSCSDDDKATGDAALSGKWNMDSYLAYMDTLPVLQNGDITWTFNSSGTSLTIVNNIEETYPYIEASGTYSVTTANGIMKINGQPYRYHFQDGKLILPPSDEYADGPQMVFSSIEE
jgi:hypothetical protein